MENYYNEHHSKAETIVMKNSKMYLTIVKNI